MRHTRYGYGFGRALLLAVALSACGDDDKKEPANDSGANDAGADDAGKLDAGPHDAGTLDASMPDAASPNDAASADAGSADSGRSEDAGPSDASAGDAARLPSLVLNEVGPSDAGYGWLEVYNPTDASISLDGLTASLRHGSVVSAGGFAQGQAVAAGEYKVVNPGYMPRDLLDPGSAGIYLGSQVVDSFQWTMGTDTSYGRCPNGSGAFVKTTAATPGAANACP